MKAIIAPQAIGEFDFRANHVEQLTSGKYRSQQLIIRTEVAPIIARNQRIDLTNIKDEMFNQWKEYLFDPEHVLHHLIRHIRESRLEWGGDPKYWDFDNCEATEVRTPEVQNFFLYMTQDEAEKQKDIDILRLICNFDTNQLMENNEWYLKNVTLIAGTDEAFIEIEQDE